MFPSRDSDLSDAFLKPSFPFRDKLRRFFWNISWLMLCRWTPKPMHAWRAMVVRSFGAKIGRDNHIYPTCKIWAPWFLETSDVVTIGPGVEVYNPGGVKMEHHSILSQDSYLCGATHDYNTIEFTYLKGQIIIEAYVWICSKAVVLPGVTCKQGSVLGAASVTSKDLEAWSVYAGNPCKFIKKRNNFLI
ncbi:putative colanic acid biosynthesis acetyltransferase WcaF [Mucilaginibacter gracilis]|uniref:Putative colanic acid biosynthesis acetyltransferase WcaF n=1 Tax=Mucilaginibacter gracilis TaxID=423350 RepID=A0A495J0M6_9SPHI|nr:putative colanic acid biosynthesis acetyltransferase [Mucilaginibacter gracilis]RKR82262.1 putative colanic acid biosynthesis acetyltransferase WcaF [Mucilaginibacter gracilis]